MHELAFTERLMKLVLAKAEEAGTKKVTGINMVVGQSSGVVPDCISFYFDYVKEGTIAQDADLRFVVTPTKLRCRSCKYEYQPEDERWNCPKCHQLSVERLEGGEAFLESLEVE